MGVLNVAAYFDHFLRFLDHAVDVRLLHPDHRRLVMESDRVDGLLDRMAAWQPSPSPTWIHPDET